MEHRYAQIMKCTEVYNFKPNYIYDLKYFPSIEGGGYKRIYRPMDLLSLDIEHKPK